MSPGRSDHRRSAAVTAMVRVVVSGAAGALAGGIVAWFAPWQVSSLLAWDTAAAVFCAWVWIAVRRSNAARTKHLATREDGSRAAAEVVLIAASVASLVGVGLALIKASDQSGAAQVLTITVTVLTVVLSWLAVQTVFVLRYAHLYYLDGTGITFHDQEDPGYGDFAYVAFTLGMTYQVSDTDLTSKPIRRTALRHALLSYLFGIAVIAITINVVAGFLGR